MKTQLFRGIVAAASLLFAAALIGCGGDQSPYSPIVSTTGNPAPGPTPDFSLSITPSQATLPIRQIEKSREPLNSAQFQIHVAGTNGFQGQVQLAVNGLSTVKSNGANVFQTGFDKTTLTVTPQAPTADATLTVTLVSATYTPGNYPFTVSATAGNITRTQTATIHLVAAGSFAVTITPATQDVVSSFSGKTRGRPSDTAVYTVVVTPQGGAQGTVTLSVAGLPASMFTTSFNPTTLTFGPTDGAKSTQLTVVVAPNLDIQQTFTFTVTASNGNASGSGTASVRVLTPP